MKIANTPFQYGQIGLQRSQDKLNTASQTVASASTSNINDISKKTAEETAKQAANPQDKLYGSPTQDGLLEAKSSLLEAQANIKVIDAADDNLGSLIDIKA